MTQASDTPRSAPVATFHARVASVGLVTTVVVLLVACLTFMLQQWAVERAQSHATFQSLAQITAYTAALASLRASPRVVAAQLDDPAGHPIAVYRAPKPAEGDRETVRSPVRAGPQGVGILTLTVAQPSLAPVLPKYIALTAILLFG